MNHTVYLAWPRGFESLDLFLMKFVKPICYHIDTLTALFYILYYLSRAKVLFTSIFPPPETFRRVTNKNSSIFDTMSHKNTNKNTNKILFIFFITPPNCSCIQCAKNVGHERILTEEYGNQAYYYYVKGFIRKLQNRV